MHTVPVCNAFDKNDYRHIKKGFAKILGNVNGFANKQLGVVKMTSCKEPPYYVNCDGFLHESNQHTNQGREYSTTNKRLIFLSFLQLITIVSGLNYSAKVVMSVANEVLTMCRRGESC